MKQFRFCRVVYAPTLEPTSEATCKPQKRGRGRPKGSKNKTKKLTMECGSQTVESSLESKMSSVSSSPSRCSLSGTPHIDLDDVSLYIQLGKKGFNKTLFMEQNYPDYRRCGRGMGRSSLLKNGYIFS